MADLVDHEAGRHETAHALAVQAAHDLGWDEATESQYEAFVTGYRAGAFSLLSERDAREVLGDLWTHLHPEPKMDGASVVRRGRISAELVGKVQAVLLATELAHPTEEPSDG
jgi:hypothetical protein